MLNDPDLLALQEVRTKVDQAYSAWLRYRDLPQQQIDAVIERISSAARASARRLAELAVQETGYGNVRDKTIKNLLGADLLVRSLRGVKTVGILRDDAERKVVEIGVPVGVVAAILPTTNPTSTAIYKTVISLKAGNGIVLSPHPRAKACTCETAAILARAALEAGAPDGLVQCLSHPSIEATNELMRHKRVAVILSTGGSGMVRAAYSSGKPAYGVGPGNVPVVIEESADVPQAIALIVQGKSFDFGTLCSSEQTVIVEQPLRDRVLAEFQKQGAFLCTPAQSGALAKTLFLAPAMTVNPESVGLHPAKIATMSGFSAPAETTILLAEIAGVGKEHPLSAEKLSPVLSILFVPDFRAALDAAESVLRFHGLGHTCGIYSNDDARVREFALRMPAMRVLCNTPTPQGSVGITTNLPPAMTLGCGAEAGNSTGDNIGPLHLINIKRLAYGVRRPDDAFPAEIEAPAAAKNASSPTRATIAVAVDNYLATRAALLKSSTRPSSAAVVDSFLAGRKTPASVMCEPKEDPPPAAAREREPPPLSDLPIADFVCENDVRAAIDKSQKIYIGPKTIVTPSARDLASKHDTLVVAKR